MHRVVRAKPAAKQTARSAHVSLATHPHQVGETAGRVLATPAKETRSARPRRDGGARVGPRLQGNRAFGPGGQPCTHVAVAALAPGRRLQQDPKTAHWKEGIAER
jgi:hypothetical protein